MILITNDNYLGNYLKYLLYRFNSRRYAVVSLTEKKLLRTIW